MFGGYKNYDVILGFDDSILTNTNDPPKQETDHLTIYPNPSSNKTTIVLELKESSPLIIKIYNSSHRMINTICDGDHNPGTHNFVWIGLNESGAMMKKGIYLIYAKTKNWEKVEKLALD